MKKTKTFWIAAAVLYALAIAPNATIIKTATDVADPYYWNLIRFSITFIVCLPFIIRQWPAIKNPKAFPWLLGSAILLTISVTAYTVAIKLSLASYVSIITLANPIFLVLISPLFTKERISQRAIAGITLAAIGAMVAIFIPIAIYQNNFTIYPLAAVLTLINSLTYVFALIFIRRANECGVPVVGSIGINALVTAIVSLVLFVLLGNHSQIAHSPSFLLAALYSGIIVCLVARLVSVKIFVNTGTAFTSALTYFETFLAILLPIVILSEPLSLTTVFGGTLILIGVYVVESHKHSHARHHFTWRHH